MCLTLSKCHKALGCSVKTRGTCEKAGSFLLSAVAAGTPTRPGGSCKGIGKAEGLDESKGKEAMG